MNQEEFLEVQNTIIENQRYIISELMRRFCLNSAFDLDEELVRMIRENNQMVEKLKTPP